MSRETQETSHSAHPFFPMGSAEENNIINKGVFTEKTGCGRVKTSSVPEPKVPSPGQPSGNNMNQVGSGPAALLYSLAGQLIGLYSELEASYNKMTTAETLVQSLTLTVGAKAQRQAAQQQASAIWCQAGASFAGAGIAIAQSAATLYSGISIKGQIKDETVIKTKLDLLDAKVTRVGTTHADLVVSEAPGPNNSETVANRATELKADAYDTTVPGATDETETLALRSMKRDGQLDSFRERLQTRIANQSRVINNLELRLQSTMQQNGIYGQIFTSAATGISQGFQAGHTAQAGQEQATQQVSQGVQQMASGTAENTRQGIGKFYDQIAGIIAAARAGAQANPQT